MTGKPADGNGPGQAGRVSLLSGPVGSCPAGAGLCRFPCAGNWQGKGAVTNGLPAGGGNREEILHGCIRFSPVRGVAVWGDAGTCRNEFAVFLSG